MWSPQFVLKTGYVTSFYLVLKFYLVLFYLVLSKEKTIPWGLAFKVELLALAFDG